MRAAVIAAVIAAALALTACAGEAQRPDIRYVVTAPEQIAATACAFGKPKCETTLGLTFYAATCTVLVPPYSARTAFIWKHEERHCREGAFHPELTEAHHARR